MIVDDGDDFLPRLRFVPRVANPIAPFFATVLVPSPWSTLRSSCFSTARCRTLATNACQSEPSSAPSGKDFVDCGVVNGCLPLGVCRDRQALPLHARIQDP